MISIGRLAAGVARELKSPICFVGYDFSTLKSYATKIRNLLQMHGELADEIESGEMSELLNKAEAIRNTWDSMEQLRDMYRFLDHMGDNPGRDDAPVTMTAPHCEAQHMASTCCPAVADAVNKRFDYTGSSEQIMNALKSRKSNQDNEHEW
jgi:hypothetical protein